MTRIFWADLETTGLNPRINKILECAVVVTDQTLEPICEFETLVHNDELGPVDPYVINMHEKNGLWEDLKTKPAIPAPMLGTWLANIADATDCCKGPENPGAYLGGSTINFDRAFLTEHAPNFLQRISHRNIDVSTVHAFCKMTFDTHHSEDGLVAHRAMADIKFSIERLRWYRRRHFNPHGRR